MGRISPSSLYGFITGDMVLNGHDDQIVSAVEGQSNFDKTRTIVNVRLRDGVQGCREVGFGGQKILAPLIAAWGDELSDWSGKQIRLISRQLQNGKFAVVPLVGKETTLPIASRKRK